MASRAGGQSGSRARWRWGSGALGILIGGSLAGCATNPATGQREVSLVSESQEIALGEQTATAARAAIGVYPDSGLQRYVRGVGMRLSGITERASLPWNFEVVDDPEAEEDRRHGAKVVRLR